MGHTNSKIIPSNILEEEEDSYFTCKECNLKIHSSCKNYYLKKKIDFSICISCYNKKKTSR